MAGNHIENRFSHMAKMEIDALKREEEIRKSAPRRGESFPHLLGRIYPEKAPTDQAFVASELDKLINKESKRSE